jgi:hypothetical protein
MKSICSKARGAMAVLVLGMGLSGCGSDNSNSGGSCDNWAGTWTGNEVDSYGADLGPATVVVSGNQADINVSRYSEDPESVILTGSCNESVMPHQVSGIITGGNHPEAYSAPLCGIYELDNADTSARIALHKPGLTACPTEFTVSTQERLFVLQKTGN